ncbi:MAG: TrbC/VirB2 family protein [Candidatus Sungiibacteriota bacterium]|uniref:TrbC/VirB2 family protein n=1 Tax=Candidatus Sungiibacteriota bacterium TaxID=2750080 RepID=A0A7T5RKY9_9BACT|nr:MAG: TrbC/VirB2 family protein [Candidatus Sungbacteria bacterium]
MSWLNFRRVFLGFGVWLNCVILTLVRSTVVFAQTEIPNPIKSQDFGELVKTIARGIQTIALPLAVVAIVFAGFQMIISSGNEAKLKEAKKTLTWVLVGTAIVVGATVLAEVMVNFAKTL